MMSLYKIGAFILFLGLLSSCVFYGHQGLYLGQKDGCGFAVSSFTGQGVRWHKSNFPVHFQVDESVPLSAHHNFASAVDHWNMVWRRFLRNQGLKSFDLFSVEDNVQYSGSPGNDSRNMLFFANDFSKYEQPRVQAITSVSSNRFGKIGDTDIIVNRTNFKYFYDSNYNREIILSMKEIKESRKIASLKYGNFWFQFKEQIKSWFQFILKPFKKRKALREIASPFPKIPRNFVDFVSLMIHELGHVPGMAHFEESDRKTFASKTTSSGRRSSLDIDSVMEPRLASGRSRRTIGDYDLNNLFCAYFDY